MTTDDKIISCYSTRYILNYLKKRGVNMSEYYNDSEELPHVLLDDSGWVSLNTWTRLLSFAMSRTRRTAEEIAYDSIMDNMEDKPSFRMKFLTSMPLFVIRNLIPYLSSRYINKSLTISINLDQDFTTVNMSYSDLRYYRKEICQFNYGALRAIMQIRHVTGTITTSACISKGDEYCEYKVEMNNKNTRRYGNLASSSIEDIDEMFRKESKWPSRKR
jgi:hypothetical protein